MWAVLRSTCFAAFEFPLAGCRVTRWCVKVLQPRISNHDSDRCADALAALASEEARTQYVAQTVTHYVHPVGTARMGPARDAGAVVDQYCSVRGIDGLRVVDASVMPTIPRANTNLTRIMLGERVADWMRAEL